MPVLKNARHELFCQEVAKGKTLTDAYTAAGYAWSDGNASLLAQKPAVSDRIKEILGKSARNTAITVQRVTDMLIEDRELARELGQAGPAVAATNSVGKLYGMFVDKTEHTIKRAPPAELTDEQLAELLHSGTSAGDAEAPTDPKELN